VIELRLNGALLPATLAVSGVYRISVSVNGAEVIPSSWSVTTGSGTVAYGFGSVIEFVPATPVPHTVHARAVGEFGLFQDAAQTVNVAAHSGYAEAGVDWEKLVFAEGENLVAKIIARDSRRVAPSRILWTLFRNGNGVFAGEGTAVNYTGSMAGIYRLKGTAYCYDGSQLAFDSTCFVEGSINVRHNLPVPDYMGTAIYLGAVFTQNIAAAGGTATSLPYQLASSTEDIFLLPGTTHWTFDLDPAAGSVDDEVTVRTSKGNWCLNGLGGGLSGESVGYDYGYMPTYIPSPTDRRIRLTADFFKVHGVSYTGFNSRVRIKCYRVLPGSVYRYERCACGNSAHPGGVGRRTRRWAAMFTRMDVQTDVSSGLNRLGTGDAVLSYTTVNTTTVPLMALSATGTPNPVPGYSGLYYTDSNLYAFYEADSRFDLAAKALSAIENTRPCCISLLTFKNSKPLISNRVKRVHGKLVVFLTEGAVVAGSVVNIKIWKALGASSNDYALPVLSTQYANEDSVLLNVGTVDIDISDYQFDETGVVVDFTVDESAAVNEPLPDPAPLPAVGPEFIYSTTYSRTVIFDGACYVNPVYVPVLDDNAVVVEAIGGCYDPLCGPAAEYCYTSVEAPAENVILPQPFGFPAPFIAYGSNPSRCFSNPVGLAIVDGTYTALTDFTGTAAVDLWAYTGSGLCGYSYLYDACQKAYAPCDSYACSMIVVYPVSSSPHATVEYGGRCYSFNGSMVDYGTRLAVGAASVNPVVDCYDAACNQYSASGSVVVYNDQQTFLEVPVRFDNIDIGLAHYGAVPQKVDDWQDGLSDGFINTVFRLSSDALVYTSSGTGQMMFNFNLPGVRKQVVVDRSGVQTVYNPGMGGSRQIVSLIPGDKVYLRLVDPYGRLPLQYRNRRVNVRWHPLPFLPRLYETATVNYAGSTTVKALGFCAYTAQGVYSFYGTLPFNGSMTGPVNPDSLVTVTAQDGQEYNLLTVRATGDVNLFPLTSLPWYSGQTLSGPFTFKFYAAREAFGAHGEMDVWFGTDGTFPSSLRAGQNVLALSGTYYRKDSAPTDTSRNSYAVGV
jgi:hypothetical protein